MTKERAGANGGMANREARIQSLVRADAILGAVAAERGTPVRLSEVAVAVGLNKTTVFNLAESLVALGFLARDPDGRGYVLGLRNLELGRIVARSQDVIELCRPVLIRLCRETRETVNLALPYLDNALIVESYEGSHGVRATSYAGTRANYHSTACGKVLLAHMAQNVRQELYRAVGLSPMTTRTLTSVEALEADLEATRRRGYAIEVEENEIGASCVGIAVLDPWDQPVASFSVAGIVQRMNTETVERIVDHLRQAVAAISDALPHSRRGKG